MTLVTTKSRKKLPHVSLPRVGEAVGDAGYLDEDGYLYLTDRKDFMIISGGVNIYPLEIENQLIQHPDVADVAVFGIPNEEFRRGSQGGQFSQSGGQ